jgi:hypothetical protein
MAMQDWIHKYPRVYALLQHGDVPLDYEADTAQDMIMPDASAIVCDVCGWPFPVYLVEVALRWHCPEASAGVFLRIAHCCACAQAGCACGGYLTLDEIHALSAAFTEANPEDDGPFEWTVAMVFQDMHADHRFDQHPLVLCQP